VAQEDELGIVESEREAAPVRGLPAGKVARVVHPRRRVGAARQRRRGGRGLPAVREVEGVPELVHAGAQLVAAAVGRRCRRYRSVEDRAALALRAAAVEHQAEELGVVVRGRVQGPHRPARGVPKSREGALHRGVQLGVVPGRVGPRRRGVDVGRRIDAHELDARLGEGADGGQRSRRSRPRAVLRCHRLAAARRRAGRPPRDRPGESSWTRTRMRRRPRPRRWR
jgi:hypothetical protein